MEREVELGEREVGERDLHGGHAARLLGERLGPLDGELHQRRADLGGHRARDDLAAPGEQERALDQRARILGHQAERALDGRERIVPAAGLGDRVGEPHGVERARLVLVGRPEARDRVLVVPREERGLARDAERGRIVRRELDGLVRRRLRGRRIVLGERDVRASDREIETALADELVDRGLRLGEAVAELEREHRTGAGERGAIIDRAGRLGDPGEPIARARPAEPGIRLREIDRLIARGRDLLLEAHRADLEAGEHASADHHRADQDPHRDREPRPSATHAGLERLAARGARLREHEVRRQRARGHRGGDRDPRIERTRLARWLVRGRRAGVLGPGLWLLIGAEQRIDGGRGLLLRGVERHRRTRGVRDRGRRCTGRDPRGLHRGGGRHRGRHQDPRIRPLRLRRQRCRRRWQGLHVVRLLRELLREGRLDCLRDRGGPHRRGGRRGER